ncbi:MULTISPECIES: hypothetical protein [unclassified Geodermatophilus]|uniref:hypothetical protein n=1 Tax=unclassified Geodermatophilus TaxID=2637632 RepID=UPI003EED02B8
MSRPRPEVPGPLLAAGRVVGAVLLGASAGIHLYLWDADYDTIPWIGPLFLLQSIAATFLGIGVLVAPAHWLPLVAVLGAALLLGTLGGLVLSVWVGLFGFSESSEASLFWQSVWVEAVGAAVLVCVAAVRPRQRADPRTGRRPVRSG